ncbi:thiol-disulfide oxidoreductase DCC family protein [Sandaracinus amylolyticus]|uniref:Cell division inhibitor n=1 Tax=Sandaracinus amylolyticus TaxID=927083 RepID=A0A0F6YKC1_9BACT|nr:DUF393 domain-containing protein [Sandaracinus amylolyticus]AKF08170.1 Hypothetical protein DB32_005319 [Sandaracinus amylolyticus]
MREAWLVEVFFDGACPLCRREIELLRRLDRRGRVRFTDIAAPGFDAHALGRRYGEMMDRIHARTADGEWVVGVEVFRRFYEAIGLGALVRITRARPIDALLQRAYETFARNRLKWTGRCEEGTCRAATDVA